MASARAPPIRVSCAFESRAAGAMSPSDSATETLTYANAPAPTSRPIAGQRHPSSSGQPINTSTAGKSASSSVSSIRSTAQMPRVIRRTMEPAKLFACQSVEKRCTRQKASPAMRVISRTVSRTMPRKARYRASASTAPRPAIAAIA